jgi:5-methylcytosine-specific restriction endonuclease McrA
VKLTKAQRATLREMFGGRCAYCGCELGDRWHADHVEAVHREWWKKGGGVERPEHDTLENLMPACPPCNIDKHAMSLEDWRKKLQRATEVLTRNQPTYRHAKRFGLVVESGAAVVFYFERFAAEQRKAA